MIFKEVSFVARTAHTSLKTVYHTKTFETCSQEFFKLLGLKGIP